MTDIFGIGFKADTTDLKKVDISLEDVAKSADKADDSLEDLNKEMKRTKATSESLTKSNKNLAKSVDTSKKGMGLAKNSAQQLGYQLQDVAVQAQMGVSPFTILGQQGSQLASVLGSKGALLGAVIAVGSAIGGVLYKALGTVKLEAKDVKEEILELTESFEDLTRAQKEALKLALSEEIEDQQKNLNKFTKAITKNEEEIKRLTQNIRAYKKEITGDTPEATNILFRNNIESATDRIKELRKETTLLRGKWDTEFAKISGTTQEFAEVATTAFNSIVKAQLDSIEIIGKAEQEKWNAIQTGNRARQQELEILRQIELSTNTILTNEMSAKDAAIAKGRAQQLAVRNTEQSAFESQLSSLQDFGKTKQQIEKEQRDQSLQMLETYAEEQGWRQEKINETKLLIESQYQQKLTDIEDSASKERAKISERVLSNVNSLADAHSDIVTIQTARRKAELQNDLANQEKFTAAEIALKDKALREIFEKEKSAKKSSIVVNTAVAASEQLNNPAGFTAAILNGAAQYAIAESAQYNSSASPQGGSTPPPSVANTTNNNGGNITTININNSSGGEINEESLKEFFQKDGILFDANTAQGELLR